MSLLILLLLSGFYVEDACQVRLLFPNEAEMNKNNFTVVNGKFMDLGPDRIFLLDQREHGVHIFDFHGRYIKTFGGYGEGPGELVWPHVLSYNANIITVVDKRGIHSFDIDGRFLGTKHVLDFFNRVVVTDEGYFYSTIKVGDTHNFGIYDKDMIKVTAINDEFHSSYDNPHYDNDLELVLKGDLIYALQSYGTEFRVYHKGGKLIKKGKLAISPLDDPNYLEFSFVFG